MKRKRFALLLVCLLTLNMLAVFEFVQLTRADPIPPQTVAVQHGYIRGDGTVDPSSLPIHNQGNVYTLTANIINYSLAIEKDNIVFDGNGFSLTFQYLGESDDNSYTQKTAEPAIQILNHSGVTIKKCTFNNHITGSFTGIYCENSTNILIIQNQIINEGVSLRSCTNCSFIGNEITKSGVGIGVFESAFINMEFNRIVEIKYIGATIGNCTYLNITRNEIENNIQTGILFHDGSAHNQLSENNFENNGVGLLFQGDSDLSANNNVFNNYWSGNRISIKSINDDGVQYPMVTVDQSPLLNSVSTSFEPPLYSLPSQTLTDGGGSAKENWLVISLLIAIPVVLVFAATGLVYLTKSISQKMHNFKVINFQSFFTFIT